MVGRERTGNEVAQVQSTGHETKSFAGLSCLLAEQSKISVRVSSVVMIKSKNTLIDDNSAGLVGDGHRKILSRVSDHSKIALARSGILMQGSVHLLNQSQSLA